MDARTPERWGITVNRHQTNPETWIAAECDGQRPGRVIFPDGKIRMIRLAGTADTFFSIPADDRRGGHGFVDSHDDGFHFHRYKARFEWL